MPAPYIIAIEIKEKAKELGFCHVAITDTDLSHYHARFHEWLDAGLAGDMQFMQHYQEERLNPDKLFPGTKSIVCVALPYYADNRNSPIAYYAHGRDYHKMIRKKLQKLADYLETIVGPFQYRAFADSAPTLEKALAEKSGLGWIGKNSIILNKRFGSYLLLGELFTDLALPFDAPATQHCGKCTKCIEICPTAAIIAPGKLDAAKCIAYLTIEYKGTIPIEMRPLIGTHVFGCDECQTICPWNRHAVKPEEDFFNRREELSEPNLVELFLWDEATYLKKTEGSPLRRTGYECWLRNLAVALGNMPESPEIIAALKSRLEDKSALVREHVAWALKKISALSL